MKAKKNNPNFKIDEIMLVLIVAIAAIVVSFYDRINNSPVMEAEKITGIILDNHDISFASNGIVNQDKLREVQSMDYTTLKAYLDVKEDFCMYLEDGNGKILLAKGSSKLANDGTVCKK